MNYSLDHSFCNYQLSGCGIKMAFPYKKHKQKKNFFQIELFALVAKKEDILDIVVHLKDSYRP